MPKKKLDKRSKVVSQPAPPVPGMSRAERIARMDRALAELAQHPDQDVRDEALDSLDKWNHIKSLIK